MSGGCAGKLLGNPIGECRGDEMRGRSRSRYAAGEANAIKLEMMSPVVSLIPTEDLTHIDR
jgi:hypothetical protein